jgi:hypothetical protein
VLRILYENCDFKVQVKVILLQEEVPSGAQLGRSVSLLTNVREGLVIVYHDEILYVKLNE